MEFFKWAAVITFIVMTAEVLKYYIRNKHSRTNADKAIEANLQEIEALKERVKNLEKIVTDPSESLKREINGL